MEAVSTLPGRMHRGVDDERADTEARPLAGDDAGGVGGAADNPNQRGKAAQRPAPAAASSADDAEPLSGVVDEAELEAQHRGLRVRRHRSLLLHWLGRWFRRPAPVVPDPLTAVRDGEVAVTFGGHASALVRYRGVTIATDPMVGAWVGGVRRAVEAGLSADALAQVDVVLISHRHVDHLHLPTLRAVSRGATLVVPPGAAAVVSPLGFSRVIELRPGADVTLGEVTVNAFSLVHGEGELAAGLAYLVRGRGPSVFVCADSAYHRGFSDVGRRYVPDIALLPIGGFWPRSFRRRHMSPLDALAAFKDLAARALVPIHHGAFALSYEELGEPLRILLEAASARGLRDYVLAMQPGQTDAFALEAPPAAGQGASSGGSAPGRGPATPGAGGALGAPLMARART